MARPHEDIQTAKRKLARALRTHEGFVGVGLGAKDIRLYALSEQTPVVRYFRSRYGHTYDGFNVSVVRSSGFRASATDDPT